MTAAGFVSVEEYLERIYHPDCDYVDGELVERNVGEVDHGRLQILLAGYLLNRERLWGITVLTEVRIQVKASRFRVPDISVVAGLKPQTRILREPPLLCIEVLSPEDRTERTQEVIDDYLAFGVRCVWVVNPRTMRGFVYTPEGMHEPKDGVLRIAGTPVEIPLADLLP